MKINLKRCTGCHELLPATPEHFSRHAASSSGLRPRCKLCTRAEVNDSRRRNGRKDRPDSQKRCISLKCVPLTQELLHALLFYEPATGEFHWKPSPYVSKKREGKVAGSHQSKGYLRIFIGGITYRAHRLVWLYVHGEWPSMDIDHINGVRDDNRLSNLRHINRTMNLQNRRSPRKGTQSNLLGAQFNRTTNKWISSLSVNGKRISLGSFPSAEEAHAAYIDAKRIYHPGNTL